MENNIISFEQIQKFWDELETWISNPINMEAIQENLLNSLRPKMTWIQKKEEAPYSLISQYYCSNCGNDEMYKTPFCPICGAMEVKE